jgi:hypothetical protein
MTLGSMSSFRLGRKQQRQEAAENAVNTEHRPQEYRRGKKSRADHGKDDMIKNTTDKTAPTIFHNKTNPNYDRIKRPKIRLKKLSTAAAQELIMFKSRKRQKEVTEKEWESEREREKKNKTKNWPPKIFLLRLRSQKA